MSSTDVCCEGPCAPLPEGFVRLRYFFGKRLGVVDLKDEQAYHRGKSRLHNHLLHGHGVLCGLGLSRFEAGDTDSGVVRVHRGAALDTCGREVVVPWDQCIDLTAWLTRRRSDAQERGETFPPSHLVTDDELRLCIAVRQRECKTTPEPAPRDPCACDTGGCEYGRVHESFELAVLLEDEAEPYMAPLAPPGPGIPCPDGRDPDWVILGCLSVTLGADGFQQFTPAPWGGPPVVLEPTAALQAELKGLTGSGSRLGIADHDGHPALILELDAEPLAATVSGSAFSLRRLDASEATGWARPNRVEVIDLVGRTVHLRTVPRAFLAAGERYRLSTKDDPEPVVDAHLRPLRVHASFTLSAGASGLELAVDSAT